MRLTFEEELPLGVGCPRNSGEARGGMCHEGRRQPLHHCVITIVVIINSSSYHHHMVEGEEKPHATGLFLGPRGPLVLPLVGPVRPVRAKNLDHLYTGIYAL